MTPEHDLHGQANELNSTIPVLPLHDSGCSLCSLPKSKHSASVTPNLQEHFQPPRHDFHRAPKGFDVSMSCEGTAKTKLVLAGVRALRTNIPSLTVCVCCSWIRKFTDLKVPSNLCQRKLAPGKMRIITTNLSCKCNGHVSP